MARTGNLLIASPGIVAWIDFARRALRAIFYGNRRIPIIGRRIKRLNAPQTYLDECFRFAQNAEKIFAGKAFDLVINSDNITLAAGEAIARATGAKRLYDAIELPALDSRAGSSFDRFPKSEIDRIHGIEALLINSCAAITAVGPSVGKWIAERYVPKSIHVVRNCRDFHTPSGSTIKKDLGLQEGDILVLFINSIYPNQGVEEVLHALQHLPKNIHFAALGPVPQPRYIKTVAALAKTIGVKGRFHILAPKPWEKMLDYASGADIGILPRQPNRLNNILSLPNRIFELTMARLPIASTNLVDIADIVSRHGIGEVFDPTKPEDIAAVIRRMTVDLHPYRKNLEAAALELCWEKEKIKFLAAVEDMFDKKNLSILILVRKDLGANNRISRLSKTLTQAGHSVTIAAPYPPNDVQRDPLATYVLCNAKGNAA